MISRWKDSYNHLKREYTTEPEMKVVGERVVSPRDIRFTQDWIYSKFEGHRDPYTNFRRIDEAVEQIKKGVLSPSIFPKIRVLEDEKGKLWSYDNKRLWVFKKAKVNSITVKILKLKPDPRSASFRDYNPWSYEIFSDPDFFPYVKGECRQDFDDSDSSDVEVIQSPPRRRASPSLRHCCRSSLRTEHAHRHRSDHDDSSLGRHEQRHQSHKPSHHDNLRVLRQHSNSLNPGRHEQRSLFNTHSDHGPLRSQRPHSGSREHEAIMYMHSERPHSPELGPYMNAQLQRHHISKSSVHLRSRAGPHDHSSKSRLTSLKAKKNDFERQSVIVSPDRGKLKSRTVDFERCCDSLMTSSGHTKGHRLRDSESYRDGLAASSARTRRNYEQGPDVERYSVFASDAHTRSRYPHSQVSQPRRPLSPFQPSLPRPPHPKPPLPRPPLRKPSLSRRSSPPKIAPPPPRPSPKKPSPARPFPPRPPVPVRPSLPTRSILKPNLDRDLDLLLRTPYFRPSSLRPSLELPKATREQMPRQDPERATSKANGTQPPKSSGHGLRPPSKRQKCNAGALTVSPGSTRSSDSSMCLAMVPVEAFTVASPRSPESPLRLKMVPDPGSSSDQTPSDPDPDPDSDSHSDGSRTGAFLKYINYADGEGESSMVPLLDGVSGDSYAATSKVVEAAVNPLAMPLMVYPAGSRSYGTEPAFDNATDGVGVGTGPGASSSNFNMGSTAPAPLEPPALEDSNPWASVESKLLKAARATANACAHLGSILESVGLVQETIAASQNAGYLEAVVESTPRLNSVESMSSLLKAADPLAGYVLGAWSGSGVMVPAAAETHNVINRPALLCEESCCSPFWKAPEDVYDNKSRNNCNYGITMQPMQVDTAVDQESDHDHLNSAESALSREIYTPMNADTGGSDAPCKLLEYSSLGLLPEQGGPVSKNPLELCNFSTIVATTREFDPLNLNSPGLMPNRMETRPLGLTDASLSSLMLSFADPERNIWVAAQSTAHCYAQLGHLLESVRLLQEGSATNTDPGVTQEPSVNSLRQEKDAGHASNP